MISTEWPSIAWPLAGTRRALFIVDAQPATFVSDTARGQLARISALIAGAPYDALVAASFSAPAGSMFDRQLSWQRDSAQTGPTAPAILSAISASGRPALSVHKTGRSVFRSDTPGEVEAFLDRHAIDAIHLVGFDINDCVLASAYDALDRGYFSHVIEDCSGRTDADATVTDAALTVLRKQAMTDRSSRLPHRVLQLA